MELDKARKDGAVRVDGRSVRERGQRGRCCILCRHDAFPLDVERAWIVGRERRVHRDHAAEENDRRGHTYCIFA